MVRHIVLFRTHPHISDAECDEVMASVQALEQSIPEIQRFEVRRDEKGGERSATFGLLSEFGDMDALERYRVHPEHQRVLVRLREVSEWIKSWDYTV